MVDDRIRRQRYVMGDTAYTSIAEIERIVSFKEDNPLDTLGPKFDPQTKTIVISAFLPRAVKAWIKRQGTAKTRIVEMQRIHSRGFFQLLFEKQKALFEYTLVFEDALGVTEEMQDPYAFGNVITDYDLYLIGEGRHYRSYDKFGAHVGEYQGVQGVHFAVWAPNAESVSVVGNFNHWRPGAFPMARIRFSGVWGLFIPGLKSSEVYKYAIRSKVNNEIIIKADPYAFQAELRPHTASVVSQLNNHQWQDKKWMKKRKQQSFDSNALSIYELHLGSWMRDDENSNGFLNYRTLAHQVVQHVKSHGFTHVELLPIMEHPLDISWGYQVINYYAPTSRFGTPEDFMYFVDYCHSHNIGVLLDWVPAHFPKDQHGLNYFDGTQLYAYADPRKGEHQDWGTLVFDYGRPEIRNFLISNALFWIDKYHLDGLRVDAVASMLYLDYSRKAGEWVPNKYGGRENLEAIEFLKDMNLAIHEQFPGAITIAEESTAWPGVTRHPYAGGLGFDLKWNMGWMHDTLDYFANEPVYRKYHQGSLTFSLIYAFSEKFVLPISHDEVVHGKRSLLEKMPGDDWQKKANLRLFLGYMFAHPGKKLLFMGSEFGQRREWNAEKSLDWHLLQYNDHKQLDVYLSGLHSFYNQYPACYELDHDPRGFEWIDFSDSENSIISFIRWSKDFSQFMVFVFNMTPISREHYRVGVPRPGLYKEVLNSDALEFGGSGQGNYGSAYAEKNAWNDRPYSLNIIVPPLGVSAFCWDDE